MRMATPTTIVANSNAEDGSGTNDQRPHRCRAPMSGQHLPAAQSRSGQIGADCAFLRVLLH
jgi:hypothetical protein